ncbi:cell wall protein [Diplodia corticola]|uniref:Cell wall protein n=1 Tax=Diplodia corticola TaxID=236234 RepID=A0A1J9QZE5_9PEZI|nr:cell wall protein [Diplodia corticola]OJD33745.1 cell wall protein [Diplodia corticola]
MVQNFTLVAVKPGSPIDNSPITASHSGLHLKSHDQPATFQLKNDELFLYADPPSQKLYTDRSGMGQGILQYTHDAQQASTLNPNRIEQSGWAVDAGGKLQLRGAHFLATPPSGGSGGADWRVWMNTGNPNPAGQTGGVEFEAKVVAVGHPVGKHYSNL